MTISTPSLPADPLASGAPTCADAGLLASLGTASAPAGQTPADAATADTAGFARLLPDASAPEPATPDTAASEQTAAFAAALLWTPAPLLVEPAPNAGLTGASAQSLAPKGEVTQDQIAQAEPLANPVAPATTQAASSAVQFVPPETNSAPPAPTPDVAAKDSARPSAAQPAATVQAVPSPQVAPAVAEASLAASIAAPAAVETASVPAVPANESVATDSAERPLRDPDFLTVGRPWRAPVAKEKIAALSGRSAQDFDPSRAVGSKTFLSATQQAGRGGEGIVGTGVAKSESTMPSAPVLQSTAAANPAALPVPAIPAGSQGPTSPVPTMEFSGLLTAEPAAQARDAVAAVLQVVNAQEQPASGTSHVVNLDFNFGADRLAVRVERLADGTVQAHFRTDSHELRAALNHEWQQAAAAPENILRFAEPVYQSSARGDQSANFGANADGSASQQGQARGEQQAAAGFSARPARAGTRPLSVTTTTEAPRVRSSSSARHLQAVA